jgi:hypothetical protein
MSLDEEIWRNAEKFGHLDILEWAKEYGCLLNEHQYRSLASKKVFVTIKMNHIK